MAFSVPCVVGTLLVLLAGVSGEACVFHPFLTGASWKSQKGIATTTYRFRGEYLNETAFGPGGDVLVSRECVENFPNHRYVFKWKSGDTDVYRCTELEPVSRNVVLIKYARVEYQRVFAEAHCQSDQPLTDSEWPMINTMKHSEDGQNWCGLEGGFDFHVEQEGLEFCRHTATSLQPRLEVGCTDNPGMHLNFYNNFNCRGHLKMKLEQTLVCMGSWEQGPYIFSFITDSADFFPKVWLLRFSKSYREARQFDIHVFDEKMINMDLEPKRTKVHKLVLKKLDFPTVCEDEGRPITCDKVCNKEYEDEVNIGQVHCMKSCGKCPKVKDDCNFDAHMRGEWDEMTETGEQQVAVAGSMLYMDGKPPLKCLNLSGDASSDSLMRYSQPVFSIFRNGCKPKYACAYLRPRGTNVMQYGVNDMIAWPYKNSINRADVCDVNWPAPFKIAIKKTGKQPVNCGIHGSFTFVGHKYSSTNQASCAGVLKSCDFRDVFRLTFHAHCYQPSETYQCLASFQEGESRLIITESEDEPDHKQCWVLHKFEGDSHTTMHQVSLTDCHVGISLAIQNANHSYHMAFDIAAGIDLTDEDTCNRVPKPSTPKEEPSSKTPESGTTTKMRLITQNIPPDSPTTEKPYNINELSPEKSTSGAPVVAASVMVLMSVLGILCLVQ